METMDAALLHDLMRCETDVEGALRRFSGNEALYRSLLRLFPEDPTMAELTQAVEAQSWDDAFTAAHALKGLAGNMGFIPLFHAVAELVIVIRTGKLCEVDATYERAWRCYKEITAAIRRNSAALQ